MSTKPKGRTQPPDRGLLISGASQSLAILFASAVLGFSFNLTRELPLKPKAELQTQEGAAESGTLAPENSTIAVPSTDHDGQDSSHRIARDITADELSERLGDGLTLVLDSRNPEDYEQGRIPGAINFPYEKFEAYYPSVSAYLLFPEQPIVCYCEGGDCTLSHDLASELYTMGYTNVFVLVGGFYEWIEAGREIEAP